jgi:hypothetical protein
MPRDALTLANVRSPTLTIVCQPCGRRGRYNVQRLIAAHGTDISLPELKTTLANCEKGPLVQRLRPMRGEVRASEGRCDLTLPQPSAPIRSLGGSPGERDGTAMDDLRRGG